MAFAHCHNALMGFRVVLGHSSRNLFTNELLEYLHEMHRVWCTSIETNNLDFLHTVGS